MAFGNVAPIINIIFQCPVSNCFVVFRIIVGLAKLTSVCHYIGSKSEHISYKKEVLGLTGTKKLHFL